MAEQDRALEPGWLLSPAGRPYLDSILHKNQRRVFGLLERPALPPALAVPTVTYKLFLAGKSGVGKTALVAWLGGTPAPPAHHETLGIEATRTPWVRPGGSGGDSPACPRGDRGHQDTLGEPAVRGCPRPQACKEEADAALFLFSFTDRASFEELPALMGRVLGPGDRDLVRMVVGTKFDLAPHAAVTEGDVRAFEGTWGLRVLRVGVIFYEKDAWWPDLSDSGDGGSGGSGRDYANRGAGFRVLWDLRRWD
ncbi:PREDICTED: REM2- and Rab-like small GTPase 1 [Ficedula albicollis]|uniref:REM2- and Rab-like small GTPase 1 n=1 Tax=Ficedula albicollis TaxID=59894 RepID=UPI0007AD7F03|nr:PREDICTED: REM2- and Rab-like small GTPase 1 [Ficedula albicollis]